MPEPVTDESERGDRRSDRRQHPDLTSVRDAQTSRTFRALNTRARDVEGPGEDEGEGKAEGDQDDEELLQPLGRVEDREDGAADLDERGGGHPIGEGHAIDSAMF